MGQALFALTAALFPVAVVIGLLGAVLTADPKQATTSAEAQPQRYVLLSRLQSENNRPSL